MSYRFFTFLALLLTLACQPQEQPVRKIGFPAGSTRPDWSRNTAIYEVNVRQYTPEGTLAAFTPHLPRLKALGTDIIWLMPIFPIGEKNRKGSLGSPYAVKDYRAVNPDLGTMADLQHLVKEAHKLGMYVILDWVANHTAWDNPLTQSHPEWYEKDSLGNFKPPVPDWHDVIKLDYNQPGLRQYMIESMQYWLTEADVDGFRCDVAMMVPTSFWEEARTALDKVKPVFMLAEAEVPEHLDYAFDMYYGWELHHIMNEIARGNQDVNHLVAYLHKNDTLFPADAYRMNFITNHDENSWNGTIAERLGPAADAMAVLMATLPGMPLIYSGQEAGLNKRLAFFEKDTINWQDTSKVAFYQTLLQQKKVNRALWNGTAGGELNIIRSDSAVLAFSRAKEGDRLLAVFNLSPHPATLDWPATDLDGMHILLDNTGIELTDAGQYELPPWSYRVLTNKP